MAVPLQTLPGPEVINEASDIVYLQQTSKPTKDVKASLAQLFVGPYLAVSQEATTRTNADNTLTTNLAAETSARTSAINTLTTNLADEVTARTNSDAVLVSAISNEAAARANGDKVLSTSTATFSLPGSAKNAGNSGADISQTASVRLQQISQDVFYITVSTVGATTGTGANTYQAKYTFDVSAVSSDPLITALMAALSSSASSGPIPMSVGVGFSTPVLSALGTLKKLSSTSFQLSADLSVKWPEDCVLNCAGVFVGHL